MTVRLPASERRQQLLEVGLQTFGTAGFHATSMNDIAAAAGVTKPVLYQHFASKDELFAEVVNYAGAGLRVNMEHALAAASGPREQVVTVFEGLITVLAGDEATYRVLLSERTRADPATAAEVTAVEDTFASIIADHLKGLTDDPAVRLMIAHAVTGMCEAALRHWYADDYALTPSQLAGQLAELAWAGLRGNR